MMTKEEFREACDKRLRPDPRRHFEPMAREALDIAVQVYADSVEREATDRADFMAAVMDEASKAVDQLTAEIATLKAAHAEQHMKELERATALENAATLARAALLEAKAAHEARVGEIEKELSTLRRNHADTLRAGGLALEERDEARAEIERLNAEMASDSLRRMLAAKIVQRAGEGIDIDDLLAANKEYEAENERLKGERDRKAEECREQGQRAQHFMRRSDADRERLALADKLADAVQKYSRTCYACTEDDAGAACTCTEASHDYNEMHLVLDSYLASREGAGEKEAVDSKWPECPGPDCKPCNGEGCETCGAGLRSRPADAPPCEHDVIERHYAPAPAQPSETPERPDPSCTCGAGYRSLCHPECKALRRAENPGQVPADARQITISEARRVALKGLDYYFENFEKDGEFDAGTSWQEMVRETVKDCRSIVYSRLTDVTGGPASTPPPEPARVLIEALRKAAEKFREYERVHLAKKKPCGSAQYGSRDGWYCNLHKTADPDPGCLTTADGQKKAALNREMAEMCEAALAAFDREGSKQ